MTDDTIIQDTDHAEARTTAAPVHLWIVGGLALLWNAIGATDYLMSQTHNDAMIRAMMPDLDPNVVWTYMDSFPVWASAGWGLGVWGAVAGSLLLLARSRHAVTAFALSLLGMALSFGYQFTIAPPPPAGMDDPIMPIVVVLIGIALFVYARAMRAKGVLR